MSALDDAVSRRRAAAAGAVVFLAKPFSGRSLLEAVRRKTARARELGAERLIECDAVERAHERAHELSDKDAVARMASIARREEIRVGAADPEVQRVRLPLLRLQQVLDRHAWVRGARRLHHRPGVVGRVVVHHQQPRGLVLRVQCEAFDGPSEQLVPVVGGKHDVNLHAAAYQPGWAAAIAGDVPHAHKALSCGPRLAQAFGFGYEPRAAVVTQLLRGKPCGVMYV